jgi:hypothetical protein
MVEHLGLRRSGSSPAERTALVAHSSMVWVRFGGWLVQVTTLRRHHGDRSVWAPVRGGACRTVAPGEQRSWQRQQAAALASGGPGERRSCERRPNSGLCSFAKRYAAVRGAPKFGAMYGIERFPADCGGTKERLTRQKDLQGRATSGPSDECLFCLDSIYHSAVITEA